MDERPSAQIINKYREEDLLGGCPGRGKTSRRMTIYKNIKVHKMNTPHDKGNQAIREFDSYQGLVCKLEVEKIIPQEWLFQDEVGKAFPHQKIRKGFSRISENYLKRK